MNAGFRGFSDDVSALLADAAASWVSRVRAPFFRPDVTVAPDPLAPDPRVVARGIAAALSRCASEWRPLRVLVGRAPDAAFRVFLHSVRSVCIVDLVSPVPPGIPSRAEIRLPRFSLGLQSAVRELAGDDIRFSVSPGSGRDSRLRVVFA